MIAIERTRPRLIGNWIERHVAKYAAVGRATIATQTTYLGEMLLRTLFLAMVLYIFVQLWTVTFEAMGQRTVAGFTVPQMVWYLMITEAIVLSRPRLTREIDAEVRGGDIAYQLIRPYDYVLFRLAGYLGERLLRFVTTLGVGLVLALVMVGPVPLTPAAVLAGLALIALGAIVDFFGMAIVGLCAFWVEDTQPLTLMYDRAIMLLGGMLLPLELFPAPIAAVLAALPFQLLLYAPTRAIVSGDLAPVPIALIHLALVLVGVVVLARLTFRIAVRRLHANGG